MASVVVVVEAACWLAGCACFARYEVGSRARPNWSCDACLLACLLACCSCCLLWRSASVCKLCARTNWTFSDLYGIVQQVHTDCSLFCRRCDNDGDVVTCRRRTHRRRPDFVIFEEGSCLLTLSSLWELRRHFGPTGLPLSLYQHGTRALR
ncbi:hypothetical protein FN846DRAFT_35538 [Sphaerosporella brunnea]|uniref:Uncharacterized protein n=1 Tax=Sphaerosporella brunnea TaxID=1250544 RepID=A0A5J5EV79_9PEZI|nr:hypothetical protein FN846DRAFT_35538 [Sphaerosporella brunnea]